MSVHDMMRAALQTVPAMLGESWSYQTLTSDVTNQTSRTYAAAVAISAVRTGDQDIDQMRPDGQLERVRNAVVRTSDSVALKTGDILIEPDGVTVWRIIGKQSSGFGTIQYRVERDTVVRVQATGRGGDR